MIMIEMVIFHRHYHSIQSFNYAIHFSPFTSHKHHRTRGGQFELSCRHSSVRICLFENPRISLIETNPLPMTAVQLQAELG